MAREPPTWTIFFEMYQIGATLLGIVSLSNSQLKNRAVGLSHIFDHSINTCDLNESNFIPDRKVKPQAQNFTELRTISMGIVSTSTFRR